MKSCLVLGAPRNGNHLVMKMLNLLGMEGASFKNSVFFDRLTQIRKEGVYIFTGHRRSDSKLGKIFPTLELKGILVSRDPRDMVVSLAFFIRKELGHPLNRFFCSVDIDECISLLITGTEKAGGRRIPSIDTRIRKMIPWRNFDGVYATTYERIVRQTRIEISKIISHLEGSISNDVVNSCIRNLIGRKDSDSYYFRKGIIGDWRNYFNKGHKESFRQVAGKYLVEEGYEKVG